MNGLVGFLPGRCRKESYEEHAEANSRITLKWKKLLKEGNRLSLPTLVNYGLNKEGKAQFSTS